jgi:hypothetical protein
MRSSKSEKRERPGTNSEKFDHPEKKLFSSVLSSFIMSVETAGY